MEYTDISTSIPSFTLPELLSLSGNTQRQGMQRECIAVDTPTYLHPVAHPCRIEAVIIGIGIEGRARISLNLREYTLRKDSLFILTPNNLIRFDQDDRFGFLAVAVSLQFIQQLHIDLKNMIPQLLQFAEHPCVDLSPDECATLQDFIPMIARELRAPESLYRKEIVCGLLSTLCYKTGDILQSYLDAHPEEHSVRDRSESYFRRFTQLLGEYYRKERSVGFYAQQLCISPKYLTTLIKRISGRAVSEWIDSYVILEAKALLKHSHMSIQEIAYSLNFPNQSFFGSYFKRNTGMSPTQYKASR